MFTNQTPTPQKPSWHVRMLMVAAVLILLALACQNPLESKEAKETRVAEAVQLTLLSDKMGTVEAQQTELAKQTTPGSPTEEPKQVTEAVATSEPTAGQQPNATDTPLPTEAPTPTATESSALDIGSTKEWPQDGMTTVYVPEGEFGMGTNSSAGLPLEKPEHTVYLDAFWIDKTEISNAMYALCIQAGVCNDLGKKSDAERKAYFGEPEFDNYPVIYVSWENAKTYCEWAGRRLPTEAEWEKAARGTDGRLYPWGEDEPTCGLAHYWGFNYYDYWNEKVGKPIGCSNKPAEVDSLSAGASPYGALHMVGNVIEWVADWYVSGYYTDSPESNPTGPSSGSYRVVRGTQGYYQTNVQWITYQGHLYDYGDFRFDLRATTRSYYKPTYLFHDLGFRCAANP